MELTTSAGNKTTVSAAFNDAVGRWDIKVKRYGTVSPDYYTIDQASVLRYQLASIIRQIHREEERDED